MVNILILFKWQTNVYVNSKENSMIFILMSKYDNCSINPTMNIKISGAKDPMASTNGI